MFCKFHYPYVTQYKKQTRSKKKTNLYSSRVVIIFSSITVFLANGIIHKCQIGDAYFFNVKMFVWQDIHDPEPRRCEDEEQEETNPRVVHEEQGPVDTRILFLKWKSVVVVHLGLKRCLYILWRLCLPVDVSRSPARNSCLNKCSLLSRPPIHEQIYNQEDLGLSHRHLFKNYSELKILGNGYHWCRVGW